ncbi:GumC family protein [Atribacter sp.]|uniref:GumC family protein n=1 Tax=Atribacter sp. TaxID=2847780 RepID=UPI00345E3D23
MEEEVSLYDLFEVLSRRKKLMWGIFLLVFALGILYAGYMRYSSKDYEAVATIMVNPVSLTGIVQSEDAYENLLNATISYPQFTNETYMTIATSIVIIEKLIGNLDPSENYTVQSLSKKLKAEYSEKTNLMKLTVKDKNPERAAEIANNWAIVFKEALNESIQDQFNKIIELVTIRVDADRKDLDRISQEIELIKEKNMDRIVIQKEMDKLTEQYLDYQKTLVDLDFIVKVQEVEIQKTKESLEKESQFIEIKKSILNEPIIMGYLLSTEGPIEPMSFSIISQELNQNYIELSRKLADLEICLAGDLRRKETPKESGIIDDLHKKILEKQTQLLKLEKELGTLEKQYEVYFNNYQTSFRKLDEIKTLTSAWTEDTNVTLLSKAIPPSEPTRGTSAKLILAVATVAGLFLAIFMAFFVEFLDKMKQYKKV